MGVSCSDTGHSIKVFFPARRPYNWTLDSCRRNSFNLNYTSVFRCLELIDCNTPKMIRSEGFLQLSRAQLGDIVKRDTLFVEEIELYERVVQWARTQLEWYVTGSVW